jgi:hypothetical protein
MRPNDDAHNDKENRQRDGHRIINIAIIAHRSAWLSTQNCGMAVNGGRGRHPADAFAVIRSDIDSWMRFQ